MTLISNRRPHFVSSCLLNLWVGIFGSNVLKCEEMIRCLCKLLSSQIFLMNLPIFFHYLGDLYYNIFLAMYSHFFVGPKAKT